MKRIAMTMQDPNLLNDKEIIYSESRWLLALETSGLGVCDWLPQENIIYFSARWKTMLGYAITDLVDKYETWVSLLHPDESEQVCSDLCQRIEDSETERFQLEFRLRCKEGNYRWLLAQVKVVARDTQGRALRVVATHADIHEAKLLHERAHYLAFYDQLTGLPNRQMLVDLATRVLDRAQRTKDHVAVCVLDIDQFKLVNDALGHEQGNLLLARLAARIQGQLRVSDLMSRLSGDNFALFLPGLDEQGVRSFVTRLQAAAAEPFSIVGGQSFYIRFSLGIAFFPDDGDTINTLLHHAEEAMYESKAQGGNQVTVFNVEIGKRLHRRIQLEVGLREAILHESLDVRLQPQIALATGELVGFESLMRWTDESGVISPAEFIPVAESSGLIVPMGYWMLEQIIALLSHRQENHQKMLPIAVNLSPIQFRQHDLADRIGQLLHRYGVDGCWLHLEVTESMVLHDQILAGRMITQLHDLGVCWALDDFGVGCSNFAYLQAHAFDVLKIDRQFVEGVGRNRQQQAIVRGMIELSHALDMHVLAEGGSLEDMSILRQLGCDRVQSFALAEPLTVQQAAALMTEQSMPWQKRLIS
jgi:diguanylate cyclase (GGDEF)-like protein/PAS domain S-box-containing protein